MALHAGNTACKDIGLERGSVQISRTYPPFHTHKAKLRCDRLHPEEGVAHESLLR